MADKPMMNIKLVEIPVRTRAREELIDLTQKVQQVVSASGLEAGIVLVYCPHTTAAITIQENADPDVGADLLGHLRQLVPASASFRHREGNSDAHIKSSLLGASQAVPFEGGRLALGTWQAIYFCELDGPRSRRVQVKLIGG